MFNGIIEEIGSINKINRTSGGLKLGIACDKIIDGSIKLGDSIAVNGVCLTVSVIEKNGLLFDVMSETIKKTALSKLKINEKVNLERAMPANGRIDGHFVQGHIDCIGSVISNRRAGKTVYLEIMYPSDFFCYIAPRGSIAVDGVSLTVAEKRKNSFIIALVEFTQKNCALADKKTSSKVNLEFDIIGKYLFEFSKFNI